MLTIVDRLIVLLVPPLAFLAVVSAVRTIRHEERIVFYEVPVAAVAGVAIAGAIASHQPARLVDVTTTGIGVFLVFGRLGCFSVACCHGRPARFGVVYGAAHVRAGLWARLAGRPLWPVQLLEAGVSAALVVAALAVGWDRPGLPATIYVLGYAALRFGLELVRGDATRPYAFGLSEAQWFAVATSVACAAWRPGPAALAVATMLAGAGALVAATRDRRAFYHPAHLRELDRACTDALRTGRREHTSARLAVSCHTLPDLRVDCVLSSDDRRWSPAVAHRIASMLWSRPEVVVGRIAGLVHVIVGPEERP